MSNDSSDTKPAYTKPYTWGPLAAVLMVLLSFLFIPIVSQLQLSLYPQLLGWDSVRTEEWLLNSPLANFLYVLATETLTVGVLLWFTAYKHVAFRVAAALGRPKWRDIGLALAGFGVYFLLFAVALAVTQSVLPIDTDQEQAIGFERGVGGAGLALAFVSLVILPPVAEEILFRGFFYGTLRARKLSAVWSMLLTSALFGSLHLFGADSGGLLWIAFVDTFVLSLVLCHLRERTGTIWSSMLVHALKNGFVFLNLFVINTLG